jgi:Flp pilus assembly protein TadG
MELRGRRRMKITFKRRKRTSAAESGEDNAQRQSILTRIRLFWFGHEDGNSLVEFTLTLPVLMAVLVAIFQFAIAFNNQLTLTQAVGVGAQYLQTIRTTTSDPCKDTYTAITNSAPRLVPVGNPATGVSLTLTMSGTPVSGSTCSGDQSDLVSGSPVTVSATYPCNLTLFGINLAGVYKWAFTCNLSAQVTEYEY